MMVWIKLCIFLSICHLFFPNEHKIDTTLIADTPSSDNEKIILPIKCWQKISYSIDILNCQYEPSCSNFMNEAILEYGYMKGVIVGNDRIVRCNPLTHTHYKNLNRDKRTKDGRIIDPLVTNLDFHLQKNPNLAMSLSIIPGLGRTYAGDWGSGLLSFLLVSNFSNITHQFYKNQDYSNANLYGIITLIFWISDFYGAKRSCYIY